MDFKWINTAPIFIVDDDDKVLVAKRMRQNLKDWTAEGSGPEVDAWNKRVLQTRHILKCIVGDREVGTGYWYAIAGEPVGIIVMTNYPSYTFIDYLVTHPGAALAGSVLIEYAVNVAENYGFDGEVQLHSADEDSTSFYESVGFKEHRSVAELAKFFAFRTQFSAEGRLEFGHPAYHVQMRLQPKHSADWVNLNGVWRLKRYEKLGKYAADAEELADYA